MRGIVDQVPLDFVNLASCQMKNSRGGQVDPGGARWTQVEPGGPSWSQVDPDEARWTQVEPDQPGGQGTVVNVGVTGPPALQW